jgi:hypothetical protein
MLRPVALVWDDVSEERIASISRVKRTAYFFAVCFSWWLLLTLLVVRRFFSPWWWWYVPPKRHAAPHPRIWHYSSFFLQFTHSLSCLVHIGLSVVSKGLPLLLQFLDAVRESMSSTHSHYLTAVTASVVYTYTITYPFVPFVLKCLTVPHRSWIDVIYFFRFMAFL